MRLLLTSKFSRCFLLLVVLTSVSVEAQSILPVPSVYPTIQEAIDAAADGNIVEVSPGTYQENLVFLGKDITVRSTDGAAVTCIDGSALTAGPTIGSVVRFVNGESSNAVLEGFKITGGSGTLAISPSVGGGIFISGAQPVIRDCVIEGNTAANGGGIYARNVTGGVLIEGCTIRNNVATEGGGFHMNGNGSVVIDRCEISQNLSNGGVANSLNMGTFIVQDCEFRDNQTTNGSSFGGGLSVGLFVAPGSITGEIVRTVFQGNQGGFGGGVVISVGQVEFDECLFAQNLANGGSAVYLSQGDAVFRRCVFTGNQSDNGLLSTDIANNSMELFNCTITENVGTELFRPINSTFTIRQSIVWSNSFTDFVSTLSLPGSAIFNYCDVEGGVPGIANLDADPEFLAPEDGDYRLRSTSPCLDAGNPNGPLDPDGTVADLGAFPFDQSAPTLFVRGDLNRDLVLDIADALALLGQLFQGNGPLDCAQAGDCNDDGLADISDALFLLNFLFASGAAPPAPNSCGVDPTPDGLPCETALTGCAP